MANTYTQIHIHTIFAVKYRLGLIRQEWKQDLYKYIIGIIQNHQHKLLAINGMPDHVHVLFGMRPTQSLSDLMQDIKGSSSKWINTNHLARGRFEWQQGFGAFSYNRSQIDPVIQYIEQQETHHQTKTFMEEYKDFLEQFMVDYDERYLFKDPE